ncbi:MAG: winged helix-turn-helix transcriptional regulator [Nitrososphaeria archaeon]
MELDEVDVEIINSLLEDGCLSLRDLTKVTGLSPPSLNSRLKRLKDSGIIKGSTVLIDRNKVKSGVSAFFTY